MFGCASSVICRSLLLVPSRPLSLTISPLIHPLLVRLPLSLCRSGRERESDPPFTSPVRVLSPVSLFKRGEAERDIRGRTPVSPSPLYGSPPLPLKKRACPGGAGLSSAAPLCTKGYDRWRACTECLLRVVVQYMQHATRTQLGGPIRDATLRALRVERQMPSVRTTTLAEQEYVRGLRAEAANRLYKPITPSRVTPHKHKPCV